MSQYAIIVVAYNRPDSLKRLLKSIESANYLGDEVTLIISIDRSNTNEVTRIAELFEWCNGKKEIRTFDCNQGLRRHILACGEYLDTYEAVAVLEDDIVVSPHFYNYMKQTINFYGDDDQIAGISLYKHEWNVVANLPFHPLDTQFDTYFMQFAQSWGQIWLRKQWNEFIKWYKENPDIFHEENKKFPHTIASWSDSSWLKYHIRYCVETNKVFVYPYVSLSTCYTEVGIHNKTSISRYQVPLQMSYVEKYNFMKYSNQALCYDVYMENVQLANQLKTQYGNVCIDLYGKKDWLYIDENKILSTKLEDYKVIKGYGLHMRPIELNILLDVDGEDIFLYDKNYLAKRKKSRTSKKVYIWNYYMKDRFLEWSEILPMVLSKIKILLSFRKFRK